MSVNLVFLVQRDTWHGTCFIYRCNQEELRQTEAIGKMGEEKMQQYTSSLDYKTTVNFNSLFNMESDIIKPIATSLLNDRSISKQEYDVIIKDANSSRTFTRLNYAINHCDGLNLKNDFGYSTCIASGCSKTTILLSSQWALKYEQSNNNTNGKCFNQLKAQNKVWKQLQYDNNINHHLVPMHRYYARYNVAFEPIVEFVGKDWREYASREDWKHFCDMMDKYNLRDVYSHVGNYGLYKGEIVALDYALMR